MTMETRCCQKKIFSKIPTICSSTPLATYEHKSDSSKKKFQTWKKKKKNLAACWAKVGLKKTQLNVYFEAARFRALDRHRSTKPMIASWILNGVLVRGSDPPSGHTVENTAGDTWRAPARRLTQSICPRACRKQTTKTLDPSPMAKYRPCFRFWDRRTPRATSHLLDHGFTSCLRGRHLHSFWPYLTRGALAVGWFYVEIEGLSSRELFLISVLTIFNVKVLGPPRAAALRNKAWKTNISPPCFPWRYERIFSRIIF